MNFKLIDKLIACLIIAEISYLSYLGVILFESAFEVYEGVSLIIFTIRMILHFAFGIVAIIMLFRNSSYSKWPILGYVGMAFIEKIWMIKPNSQKYLEALKDAQVAFQNMSSSDTTLIDIEIYPYWWVFILYFTALLYVFIIKRYN